MNKRQVAFPALIAVIALSGFGCNTVTDAISKKVTEKVIENTVEKQSGGDMNLDLSKGQINYKADDGSQVSYGSDLSLPKDFPSVVPVYAGAKIVATSMTSDGSTATLSTTDKTEAVMTWYEAQLNGWNKESSFDSAGYSMRVYKKDTETITLTVGGSDDQTSITISYTKEQPEGERSPS